MSDSLFSLSSLAIVIPVVALATYAIVLNLDRIIQIFVPLTSTTPKQSSSWMERLISAQIRKMQLDQNIVWRERGEAFERSSLPWKSSGKPSKWRILQFVTRGIFLPVSNVLIIFFNLMSCIKARRRTKDDEFIPTPARNVGDVEVQVQVDVSVEKGWIRG
jgi:hypothetical protein